MKKLVFALIFMFSVYQAFSQKATTFQKVIESGTSIKELDSLYKPALSSGADSMQAAFYGKYKEVSAAYTTLLKDLGKYLHANHFKWGKNTRCWNRIYFTPEGTVDYFLFNFRPGEITSEKEQQFEKLLNEFIKIYKFPLTAKTKFAQCSPVTYID